MMSRAESAESVWDVWEIRRAVTELPPEEQEIVRRQPFEGSRTRRSRSG